MKEQSDVPLPINPIVCTKGPFGWCAFKLPAIEFCELGKRLTCPDCGREWEQRAMWMAVWETT